MADGPGFLRRWSDRKAAARSGQPAAEPEVSPPAAAPPAAADPTATGETADREAPPLDLPDIDSLDADSDYTVFLQRGVPEELRLKALRKLWRSDPLLANLDGLVDYADDYTDRATVVAGMKTLYQVGRGLLDPESEPTPAAGAATQQEAAGETAGPAEQNGQMVKDSGPSPATDGEDPAQS